MAATDPKLSINIAAAFSQRNAKVGFDSGKSQGNSYAPPPVTLQPSASTQAVFEGTIAAGTGWTPLALGGTGFIGYAIVCNLESSSGVLKFRKAGGSDEYRIPVGGAICIAIYDGASTAIEISDNGADCDYQAAIFEDA